MHCHRCNNLMFPIALQDGSGGMMHQEAPAWRCFACGEIVDQLIRENRNRGSEGDEEWRSRGARHRRSAVALLR